MSGGREPFAPTADALCDSSRSHHREDVFQNIAARRLLSSFQTARLRDMERTLRALRFWLSRPRRGGLEVIVGVDTAQPRGARPVLKEKWCDVRAGDRVEISGVVWTVAVVWLHDSEPAPLPGHSKIASGRDWLSSGETFPDVPLSTPSG